MIMHNIRAPMPIKQYLRRIAAGLVFLLISGCTTADKASVHLAPTSNIAEFATQDPIELLVIGKRAYNSKHFDLAERALLESIKLSPTVIDAHLYLGNLYFLSDRYALSREQYAKALQLDKSNLIASNNIMLIDLRQSEKSLGLLENVLQQHSKDYDHVQSLLTAIQTFLKPGQKTEKPELINSEGLSAQRVSSEAVADDGSSE